MQYAMTAGPDDVGQRVVVRQRVREEQYNDVLGELLQWDERAVSVRDKYGQVHSVPRNDVVAAKRVPPPPEPRPAAGSSSVEGSPSA